MKRVLVTAATTPLGRALIARLLRSQDTEAVLAVARDEPIGEELYDERVQLEHFDLTRERDVRTLMKGQVRELAIDSIVHGALHRNALDGGRKVHALNVESTRMLLGQVKDHSTIKRFVYRSYAEVYKLEDQLPTLIGEDHPLEFSATAPQRVRDRVEADLTVCAVQGLCKCSIAVLRCAEVLAPQSGSQLWDYLQSHFCFRPAGYNPVVNILSVEDAAEAIYAALQSEAEGVFNIPGYDSLPISALVEATGRRSLSVPGPFISPFYRLRAGVRGTQFRYDLNKARFHLCNVLDGRRARADLGYEPRSSALPLRRSGQLP